MSILVKGGPVAAPVLLFSRQQKFGSSLGISASKLKAQEMMASCPFMNGL